MKNNYLTYKKSGVDIKAADNFVKYIANKVKETKKSGNLRTLGDLVQFQKYLIKTLILSLARTELELN